MQKYVSKHDFSKSVKFTSDKMRQKGAVIWLFGLSGSGKSTIANELSYLLAKNNYFSKILDGDDLRSGLNSDLGFSVEDRRENLRRASEVAKLFAETGLITICSFITPKEDQRELIKQILKDLVHFVYIDTNISECESRDPKGLYKKSREGHISNFTGVDSKFESPLSTALSIKTTGRTPEDCAMQILEYLTETILTQ